MPSWKRLGRAVARPRWKRSLLVAAVALLAAQTGLFALRLPSPKFFRSAVVSQKYDDLLTLHAQRDVRIVAVGHSHVVLGLDAARLEAATGKAAFNMGLPATDLRVQSILVRDFLIPRIRPELIVWHIDPQLRSGFRANQDLLESDAFRLQKDWGPTWGLAVRDMFPFHRRSVDGWLLACLNRRDRRYDRHGYIRGVRSYADEKAEIENPEAERVRLQRRSYKLPLEFVVENRRNTATIEYELEHADKAPIWEAFEDALRCAEEHQIAVVAFSAPRHLDTYRPQGWLGDILRSGEWQEDIERFEEVLARHRIPYANYRYYPPISNDDTAFGDVGHLNYRGAEQLTDLVAAHLINKTEPIPDELAAVLSAAEREVLRTATPLDGQASKFLIVPGLNEQPKSKP